MEASPQLPSDRAMADVVEVIVIVIAKDACPVLPAASVVRGPSVESGLGHCGCDSREDRAPDGFDSTEPFLRRCASPNVGAIKFIDEVVAEFFPHVTLDRFRPSVVGEMLPGFHDFVVNQGL